MTEGRTVGARSRRRRDGISPLARTRGAQIQSVCMRWSRTGAATISIASTFRRSVVPSLSQGASTRVFRWDPRWNNQMFAARGFVVAEVNFHGSTGYGQRFTDAISKHWGDYPFDDLMKGLDVVARLPYVDSTRMGAAGASYGGYMVYWLAGHTNRFKALVDHDGVFNPASMAGSTEELWFTDWEFGGPVYANRALYEKWSPLNFVQY